MIRTTLRALLLVGVLAAPASAGTQSGVWSSNSKHYGKTILSVPTIHYSVKVDSAGKVLPLDGSSITVSHEETGAACHKVIAVSASYQTTGISTVTPKPSHASPYACSFGTGMATFKVTYPITSNKIEEDLVLRRACETRPAGTTRLAVALPQVTGFKILLEYTEGIDQISYPAPLVSVTCESLALESSSLSPTSLTPKGGAVTIQGKITSPVAVVKSVRARLTAGGTLSHAPLTLASGTGQSGVWSGVFQAPANVSTATLRYAVAFEATDDKGSVTILESASPLFFVVSSLAPKAPVLPTSTAKPAPTLPH